MALPLLAALPAVVTSVLTFLTAKALGRIVFIATLIALLYLGAEGVVSSVLDAVGLVDVPVWAAPAIAIFPASTGAFLAAMAAMEAALFTYKLILRVIDVKKAT